MFGAIIASPILIIGLRLIKQKDDDGWWWVFGWMLLCGVLNGAFAAVGPDCFTDWDGRSNRVFCD